jgi:hypothetical protein
MLIYFTVNIIFFTLFRDQLDGTCGMHGRAVESVQGFGGKARRKETTWKTEA